MPRLGKEEVGQDQNPLHSSMSCSLHPVRKSGFLPSAHPVFSIHKYKAPKIFKRFWDLFPKD